MAFVNLKELKPRRITKTTEGKYNLFYGLPKIGKTTLVTKFPKSLLLACEPGYNALDNIMVVPIHNWEDFISIKKQLCLMPLFLSNQLSASLCIYLSPCIFILF